MIEKILRLIFIIASRLWNPKNVIVFESFLGKQYSDNPKAIYEYVVENYPEYQLYWSVDRRYVGNFQDTDINYLIRLSPRWLLTMATAKYWVVNSRLPLWIPKPKHTTYIQTWHGTPLKKLGIDIEEVHMSGAETETYKREFLFEAGKWDFLISPNAYSSNIFKRAFGYDGEILEMGYPRNDILYTKNNPSEIFQLKQKLNIPFDKKVILYAPTWRDDEFYQSGKYRFELQLDLEKLKQEISKEYIIILRLHYLITENLNLEKYTNFAFDFSNYNDINELYLISDILITDYSSVFFDYANLKKPILFFTYDLDKYRDKVRGFYFNIETHAPGPIVKDTDQVLEEIKRINSGQHQLSPSFEKFYQKFCYLEDGHATERVSKAIYGKNK